MSDTVKLKRKVLITVGREYGSAGHIVARRLGERLSIPVFDKNLLTIIARKHGLDEITLLSSDERVGNLFFDSYAPYSAESGSISERLFVMQANIIKEEADKGSAIFVGRCANDILRKYDDVLSFFIFARKRQESTTSCGQMTLPTRRPLIKSSGAWTRREGTTTSSIRTGNGAPPTAWTCC